MTRFDFQIESEWVGMSHFRVSANIQCWEFEASQCLDYSEKIEKLNYSIDVDKIDRILSAERDRVQNCGEVRILVSSCFDSRHSTIFDGQTCSCVEDGERPIIVVDIMWIEVFLRERQIFSQHSNMHSQFSIVMWSIVQRNAQAKWAATPRETPELKKTLR